MIYRHKRNIIALFIVLTFLSGCTFGTQSTDPLTLNLKEGVDTIQVGTEWVDAGCETNGIACTRMVNYDVDNLTVGYYEVYYVATNATETSYILRGVNVVDIISPVITLFPGHDTVKVNSVWEDEGCSASDNYDSDVECGVLSSNLDLTTIGEYEVLYQATDDSGNETIKTRYVFVIN